MLSTTSKFTEMPPHFFTSFSTPSRTIKPPFTILFHKPLSTTTNTTTTTAAAAAAQFTKIPSRNPTSSSSSWLNKWPSPPPHPPPSSSSINPKAVKNYAPEASRAGTSAIDRIVLRLRNLGLGSDDEDEEDIGDDVFDEDSKMSVTGEEKLGDLLKREWVRPDMMLVEEDEVGEDSVLPWEKEREQREEVGEREVKKRAVRAPSLAELTIEDEELRRLRRQGMTLRERVNVPKAGVTNAVLEKIHEKWRKNELVRLKFHEVLARDMKTAHEIVEVGILDYDLISS